MLSPRDPHLAATGPHGLTAWTESQGEIATLFIASQGQLLATRSLARGDTADWGYEGCTATYLAWHGECIVVVSSERSSSYLRVFSKDDLTNDTGLSLPYAWQIHRDLLIRAGFDPGLLNTAALPSLETRTPLPIRGAPAPATIRLEVRAGEGLLDVSTTSFKGVRNPLETLGLPTEQQLANYESLKELLDLVERRFQSPAPVVSGLRLVIEAVADPYVRGITGWRPVPVWIPVYWYHHLISTGRKPAAQQLLNTLDEIAAPLPDHVPEHGWMGGPSAKDCQIDLAVRHVRRQARILAKVCRTGVLPPGWWCLLFDPAPRSNAPGSRVNPAEYPPLLRQVFEELVRSKPQRLATHPW